MRAIESFMVRVYILTCSLVWESEVIPIGNIFADADLAIKRAVYSASLVWRSNRGDKEMSSNYYLVNNAEPILFPRLARALAILAERTLHA